jgi:peptidoglycan-associated lipoprotein
MSTQIRSTSLVLGLVVAFAAAAACGRKPPVAQPGPATTPPPATTPTAGPPAGPTTPPTPPSVPSEPAITSNPYDKMTLDEINDPARSPFKPVFFEYDSDQLNDTARQVLQENARVLKENATFIITIEGHADERGSPEYNLALGERRALATKSFLVSLGVGGDRLQTVSYGKEFPFDPGHTEEAWFKNRRAHFMVTKK